jgi:porphobilinogen deaminase
VTDRLVIATRGSALALWQAEHVKARLEATRPGLAVELLTLSTAGDRILDVAPGGDRRQGAVSSRRSSRRSSTVAPTSRSTA